jgi:SAM-dependent methyltransferase
MKTHGNPEAPRPFITPKSIRVNRNVIDAQIRGFHAMEFACPSCHGPLIRYDGKWQCQKEGLRFGKEEGVMSLILPHRRKPLETFLKSYQKIRHFERWGSLSAQYYRDLPYHDRSGEHSDIWRVRARTFECFQNHLLRHWPTPPARVLDAGAGNCWLSARLAERGFQVVAMDVNLDPLDGLGALQKVDCRLLSNLFPVRAEFDHWPFNPRSFDIIIFNASIHYAKDVSRVLGEALNLLREGGLLYILDTPLYRDAEDGNRMLDERRRIFQTKHEVVLPAAFAGSFLTFAALDELRAKFKVEILTPDYGLSWTIRPLIAALLGRRRPAAFRVIAIHTSDSSALHTENIDSSERIG